MIVLRKMPWSVLLVPNQWFTVAYRYANSKLLSFISLEIDCFHSQGGVIGGSTTPQHRTNAFEDTASPQKKFVNTAWKKYG
jgi:hypothetical protein